MVAGLLSNNDSRDEGARICTLTRDATHTPQFHDGWWKDADSKETQDRVEAEARRAHTGTPV